MIFPIGQEDATVQRLPWVTISIALACFVAFVFTWLLPTATPEALSQAIVKAAVYWAERPYLDPSPELKAQFDSPAMEHFLARYRANEPIQEKPSDDDTLQEEQLQLDQLITEVITLRESMPMHRYALVPARGARQLGWLSHMFLHFGWLHLLGNLFFLYLVGPFLEDVWGRPLFTGFYFIGGLIAALAQFAIMPHAQTMIAGASGAIAAAMGAFSVRFATRKIRFLYFFWIVRIFTGTFKMAAWISGLLWFGDQLLNFALAGSSGGVAFAAHIGGFIFGAVFALALAKTGIEAKVIAPKVEAAQGGWSEHPQVAEARRLLGENDAAGARVAFARALGAQPENEDALLGLGRLELEAGEPAKGMSRVGQVLAKHAGNEDGAAIRLLIAELGPLFAPERLRPPVAYQAAQVLEAETPSNAPIAEPLYRAAGAGGGVLGIKALVRAAEIDLEQLHRPMDALELIAKAEAIPGVAEPQRARLAELKAAADERVRARPDTGGLTFEPNVTLCTLLRLAADGLDVEGGGRRFTVPFGRVLAVAVGRVPNGNRQDVVTDLVLNWGGGGEGASVMRFSGRSLNLPAHFAGVDAWTAHGRLVAHLLAATGATPLPDRDAMEPKRYRAFEDIKRFEAACYGGSETDLL